MKALLFSAPLLLGLGLSGCDSLYQMSQQAGIAACEKSITQDERNACVSRYQMRYADYEKQRQASQGGADKPPSDDGLCILRSNGERQCPP